MAIIDQNKLAEAVQLKKVMDATYIVFRKEPNTRNANAWTVATRAFNDFCVEMIRDFIRQDNSSEHENILRNPDRYTTCKQCGAEVLFMVGSDQYVKNINYVEGFPGWCYDCLLKHCLEHNCSSCEVTSNRGDCPFSEIKKIHMQNI